MSHVISVVAEAITLYSASADDLEITDCFLDFHQIGDFPRRTIYPVTDLLVLGQDAQSESLKACKVS